MSIYFNQPGEKSNSSNFVEVLKEQDQLIQELFAAVKTHQVFQKEEKRAVQKKFTDLKQLFVYANLEGTTQLTSFGDQEKKRIAAHYGAENTAMAIANLINEIQEQYVGNFSRELIAKTLFLNYSAKNNQELKTLDQLADRATALRANFFAKQAHDLKQFMANEERNLWEMVKKADHAEETVYAFVLNSIQKNIDLFQSDGKMGPVQAFNQWQQNYSKEEVDKIILWVNKNEIFYLPHDFDGQNLLKAKQNMPRQSLENQSIKMDFSRGR